MLRFHRLLWFGYLISMPVVSAFSLTQAVNAPLILSVVLIFPLILNGRIYFDKNAIILLFVFCTPIVFSAAVNFNSALEPKFINHALSYFVVYFLFYLIPRQYLRYFRDDKIENPIAFGWSLAVVFGLIEFLLVNFFSIDFSNYIPRAEVVDYMPTVEGIIIRARSFAEESAHFMIYAGIFYYILRYYKKVNFVLTYFFVAAMIVSFGVAAWIAFLIAEIYRFTRNSQRLNFKRVVISIFIFGSLVWYFFDFFDTFIFGVLIDKFTSSSSEQRMELFLDHASIFFNGAPLELLFGLGPGYYAWRLGSGGEELQSVISLPVLALFQTGLYGLVLLVFIFIKYFYVANKLDKNLVAAVIFLGVCYLTVSNYWFPWMWFLFAILDDLAAQRKISHAFHYR